MFTWTSNLQNVQIGKIFDNFPKNLDWKGVMISLMQN